jgi:hypothetical protein
MRAWRQLKNQEGIALVVVLGALTVLSIAGATAAAYTTSNVQTGSRSAKDELSFSLSEAALNNAMAVLANPSNNALHPRTLPNTEALASTAPYEGGTAKWWGVLDPAQQTWTVHAVGLYDNPTGSGVAQVRRKLTAKVPVFPTNTQLSNNPVWSYIYARSTGSPCDVTLANNLAGSSQFYVRGNLCLSQNVSITQAALIVHGNLDLANNAFVGASTSMSTRVETYVGGQCRYGVGSWSSPPTSCSGDQDARKIFSKTNGVIGVNGTAPVIADPAADFADWYENGIPGPAQGCTTVSGTPPTFDTNYPSRDNSVPTDFNLTPATSYTCRVGPAENASGELSWNATTRVLTVRGTIYIDGSASVTNGFVNQYNGQSTLYLSGTFAMNNGSKLCGGVSGSDCNFAAWDPNTEMLTVVAEGTGGLAGVGNIDNNGQFQGGLFGTGAVEFSNNARSDGPIVGSTVKFNNNVQNDTFPTITEVPAGMPGTDVVYAQPNSPEMFAG